MSVIQEDFESDTAGSASDMSLTEQISIRPFQLEDQDGVFRVLRDSNYHNLTLAFRMNITGPTFQALVVVVVALAIYTSKSIVYSLIAVTLCFGVVAVLHLIGSLYYLHGTPLEDVRNVKNVYFEDADCHFWVAEVISSTAPRRRIVGTIAIVRRYEREGKVAWLRRLAVLKNFRRRGIAKQLIVATMQFCKHREYSVIELHTTSIHQTARALYIRLGFECTSYTPYRLMGGLVKIPMYVFQFKLAQIDDTLATTSSLSSSNGLHISLSDIPTRNNVSD